MLVSMSGSGGFKVVSLVTAVLVLVAGACSDATRDDGPVADNEGGLTPLIAGDVPEGYALLVGSPGSPLGDSDLPAVYVPADASYPFDGPKLWVSSLRISDDAVTAATEVSVMEVSDQLVLKWRSGQHRYEMTANGLSLEELMAVQPSITDDETDSVQLDPDLLPPGWRAVGSVWRGRDSSSSGYLDYRTTDNLSYILIRWAPGAENDLDLLPDSNADVEVCTAPGEEGCDRLDGRPTVVGRTTQHGVESLSLTWVAEGRVTSVESESVSLDELYAVAHSLRTSTWEEIEQRRLRPSRTDQPPPD